MKTHARCVLMLLVLTSSVVSCGKQEAAPPAPTGQEAASPTTSPAPAPEAPTPEAPTAEAPIPATSSADETGSAPADHPPQPAATPPVATAAPPATSPAARPEAAPSAPAPAPTEAPTPVAPPRVAATPAAQPAPASANALPQRPQPKGNVTLPAKLGAVTFDHGKHVSELKIECATCHHPSRAEKPLEAQRQACRECHTQPAVAPVKTSLRDAMHDAKAVSGICVGCHRDPKNEDLATPVKCADCHDKTAR